MIDIENQIFNDIATALRDQFEGIFVTGEYIPVLSHFPCATIREYDNYADTETATTSSTENHAIVVFDVNIYSNKTTGRKAECKAIAKVIDEIFVSYNFTRTMLQPIPNELDSTIYRITGRYEAEVDKNEVIYRR